MIQPKKSLGQHFLIDHNIAQKMVKSLPSKIKNIMEIGPGTGALTKFLVQIKHSHLWAVEIDEEAAIFLKKYYPQINNHLIKNDILKVDWTIFGENLNVIGNFPYFISSQILFKVLDYQHQVSTVVCMLQKEVAMRITSPKGNKVYGVLSVLLQAYYDIEFLFDIPPTAFFPQPKVNSAAIRLKRNTRKHLNCNEQQFRKIVKCGFQHRRKTLRNALKKLNLPHVESTVDLLNKRAEQLSVGNFIFLTQQLKITKW